MKIGTLRTNINDMLNGEMLSTRQIISLSNNVIDDINNRLNARFPYIDPEAEEYTAIEDCWIRQVIVLGAVHLFYLQEDEGTPTDQGFNQKYEMNLYYMLQNCQVPEEYDYDKINSRAGAVASGYDPAPGIWAEVKGNRLLIDPWNNEDLIFNEIRRV